MTAVAPSPALFAVLAFNAGNQLAVRKLGSKHGLAFTGSDLAMATARLESSFRTHTPPAEDRKSTRLNSSHVSESRMPSSA